MSALLYDQCILLEPAGLSRLTAVGVDDTENAADVFGGLKGEMFIDEAGLFTGESALQCRRTCMSAKYENGASAAKWRSTCFSLLELSRQSERGQSESEEQAGESIA